ncbi:MAG: methyltransferase domain-containing protein [Dehalococcoidia bacterium]|nr:methyltransferase domain-containing protein [Dehalococcoidia bacterium]
MPERILTEEKGHRCFAGFYDRLSRRAESTFMREVRPRVQGAARGRTLEIGLGTGAGLPYYPADVTLVAVEPDPYMFKKARDNIADLKREVELQQAPAEDLPFPGESFDTVVTTLVLCSVTSQMKALGEIKRVLKPGGRYHFYEHVRYRNPIGGFAQDLVRPIWSQFGGGCSPNRRTWEAIEQAGFDEVSIEHESPIPPIPPLCFVRPHIIGFARKAGESS